MLHFMRKHAKFFYIFFFLIIISFVFFYVGPVDRNSNTVLVEIGNSKIYLDEYWKTYDRLKDFYRDIYKDRFDDKLEKKLDLKDKALEMLLDERLLAMKARQMGLAVSDRELQEAIMNEPAFKREGVFRRNIYLRTLQLNRLTPRNYENSKRQELLINKMRSIIEDAATLTPEDISDFKGNNEFLKTFKNALLADKRQKLLRSYIETLKKRFDVTVHRNLLS